MLGLFSVSHEDRLGRLAGGKGYTSLGKAAEHLVCSELLIQGYPAFIAGEGFPYDIAVDVGSRLVRLQVKSTCFPKSDGERRVYWFKLRRKGNGKKQLVSSEDCDVIALVALDIMVVAYLPVSSVSESIKLRPPGSERMKKKGKRPLAPIDCYPFEAALTAKILP